MSLRPPALGVRPDESFIRDTVEEWVRFGPLRTLIERFGGPRESDRLTISDLAAWSSAHWDFRGGRERNLVNEDAVDGELEQHVLRTASDLGLVEAQPPLHASYDFVLMLGGLIRACVWRPEYASYLARTGTEFAAVAAISGFRALNDEELQLAETFGVTGCTEEHEVMEDALCSSFSVNDLVDVVTINADSPPNLRSLVRRGESSAGHPVTVAVAPSSDPTRRANTADGYSYWSSVVENVTAEHRILMVTSSIYVPFQHADAVRILGVTRGCTIETVGLDPKKVSMRGEPQQFRGVNYLQEINSTLRSFSGLVEALTT